MDQEPKRFNFLRAIFISLLLLAVLIPIASFTLAHLYRDKIRDYILAEVNKELVTPVSINEKVDFTVFQQFPYVSLELNDVFVREVTKSSQKDTLFYFSKLYLGFNLMDVINKNYNIKKIAAEKGVLKIKRDKDGNGNYKIFRSRKDTTVSPFSIELSEVTFVETRLFYADEKLGQEISSDNKKIKLQGKFSDKKFSLNITSQGILNSFSQNKKEILANKKLGVQLIMNVNSDEGIYQIEKGKLNVAAMQVEVSGSVRSAKAGGETDLVVQGKNFDVSEIISLLPEKAAAKLKDYKSDGSLFFKAAYKGRNGAGNIPSLNADFGIEKGEIAHKPSGISLDEVSVKGNYLMKDIRESTTAILSVSSFHASLADGILSGAFSIKNFSHPDFQTTIDADFDLRKLASFLRIDTLEQISGAANLNASFRASFNDPSNITAAEISRATTSGNLSLKDVSFKIKDSKRDFKQLNGDFSFHNNQLDIERFSGMISGIDFMLTGYFQNILQYFLLPDEQLYINASARSELVDLDQLLAEGNSENESSGQYRLTLSPRLGFDLELAAKELKFRKFSAKNIHGVLKLKNSYFTANQLMFETMNGSASADLSLIQNPAENFDIVCNTKVSSIDVKELFYQCENFGQTFIVSENVRGNATASINLTGVLSSSLKMDLSKMVVESNLAISKGEIVNFKPLKELSRFIKVDDLEHVKFSTLSNNITISDRKVIIPLMKIQSSALDLDISGTHSFDNEIEYHFRVFLSDILGRKAKKAKPENEEFSYIEDDGRGRTSLFLTMKGTVNDFKFSYDSRSVRNKIKEDMKKEHQSMKALLHEEFGLFKKDSASFKKSETEKETELKIEWEDMPEKEKKQSKKQLKKVKSDESEKKDEAPIKIEFE